MTFDGCRNRLLYAAGLALSASAVLFSIPDTLSQSPPTVESASVQGSSLTITLSESLTSTSTAVASEFAVEHGADSITVSSLEISGAVVTLTLMEAVPDVDCTDGDVSVGYSPSTSSLIGISGGKVARFSNQAVVNRTDAAPQIVSIETDTTGRYIYVTFCEKIAAGENGYLTISAFSAAINGRSELINDVTIRTATTTRLDIQFAKRNAVSEGDAVTVSYNRSDATDGDRPQDANQGGKQVESWSNRTVANRVDSPPTLVSVSALYDVVTLTFSEALDEDSVPSTEAFSIGNVQHAPGIGGVSVSDSTVILTMNGILHNRDSPTYTFSYSEPNESPLRQADGAYNVEDISLFEFESDTPTKKPAVTSAAVDGAVMRITFDLPLKAVASVGAFSIGGLSGVTVTGVSYQGSFVSLTLSPAVSAGAAILVSYTKPNAPPRIEARNNVDADSFANQSVINNTVAPIPEFSSAAVTADGATLTIMFSVALDESAANVPATSTFSLSGTDSSVQSVSVSGSTVSLTLDPLADVDETITVGYTSPTDDMAGRLQSAADAQVVATFSGQAVANNADGKPRPVLAEVDGDSLIISFDRGLDASSLPAASSFTLTVTTGTTATVTGNSIDGSELTLTLNRAVNHTENLQVSYAAPGASPLKRDGQDILVDSFDALSVVNSTPNPTPTFRSASIDASGRTLTIVMSHPLLSTSTGIPGTSRFSLTTDADMAIATVSIGGANVKLGLSPAADVNETVTISYQPASGTEDSALQSVDRVWKTEAWHNQPVTNNADGKPKLIESTVLEDSLVLRYDRALDGDNVPANADFSLTPAGISVTNVDIDGAAVTLTLSQAVQHDDAVAVSYSGAGSNRLKRDGHEIFADGFSMIAVKNNTPEPLVLSVQGDGSEIVVTFSVALETTSSPTSSAFSLGADQPAVTAVDVANMSVTLTLAASLVEGSEYALAYTAPETSPLKRSDLSEIPDFEEAVDNRTDVAPTADSVVGEGDTLTVTFDQPLDDMAQVATSSFSLSGRVARTVSELSVDGSSLSLRLSSPLTEDEEVLLTYAKPTQDGIVDPTGNQAESFTAAIDNQTDTAPVPVSGTAEDKAIIIILDQELAAASLFDLDLDDDSVVLEHFTLAGSDTEDIAVVRVAVSNDGPSGVGRIAITLSHETREGKALSLTYFPDSGTIRIRDDDAGRNRAQINNYPLNNLNDKPPVVESAIVDGTSLIVTFDQALDGESTPDGSAFSLSDDGPAISMASISGETLTLRLATRAVEDVAYRLTYTAPESGKLRDLTGNETVGFTEDVENVTDYAPRFVSVKTNLDGTLVLLRFDQSLDASGTIDKSWFELLPGGAFDSVIMDPDVPGNLQLKLAVASGSPIREGASVEIAYDPPENEGLKDDDAGNPVESITRTVDNLVDVAPVVEAVTVQGRILEIRFDQLLDVNSVPPTTCQQLEDEGFVDFCAMNPNAEWFVVHLNGQSQMSIDAVELADEVATLTLADAVRKGDAVEVEYQSVHVPPGRDLQDTSPSPNRVIQIDRTTAVNVTPALATSAAFDRSEPDLLSVQFDADLASDQTTDGAPFSVTAGESEIPVESIAASGIELRMRLTAEIPECVSVGVGYEPGEGPLLDSDGHMIEPFSFDVVNLIDLEWGLRCVASDFGGMLLTFGKAQRPERSGFEWTLSVDGEGRAVHVESLDDVVRLLPESSVCQGDAVEIQYSSEDVNDALAVSRSVAQAAPCAGSAVANGVSLQLTFDGPLDDVLPDPSDFSLPGNAAVEAIEEIAGVVLAVRLVSPGVRAEQGATIRYTGDDLTGSGLTVGPFSVEISDRTPPPELESAYGVGESIFLVFDQPLISRDVPVSRFIPIGLGDDQSVEHVSVGGNSVYLELSSQLPDDPDVFGLAYVAGARGRLAGLTGSRVGDSVFLVRNYTETPPSLLSAVVDALTVELTFDQPIVDNGALASDFTVAAGRRTNAVTAMTWSEAGVRLTLSERVTSLDAVVVRYAPGEGRGVRDRSGLPLEAFEVWAENRTSAPGSMAERISDARIRSGSDPARFARELARGFASDDGIRVGIGGGTGSATVARAGMRLSIDAAQIGDSSTRVTVAPIDHVHTVLGELDGVSESCWNPEASGRISAWLIGTSDSRGVPADQRVSVTLRGAYDPFHTVRICVMNLTTGEWQFHARGQPFVGPALLLIRETPAGINRDPLLRGA